MQSPVSPGQRGRPVLLPESLFGQDTAKETMMTDTAPVDAEVPAASTQTPEARRLFLKQMLTAVGTAVPLSTLGVLGASPTAEASDCDPNTQSCGTPKANGRTPAIISADGERIRSMATELQDRQTAGKLGWGLPMVDIYQAKGGADPHTIQVLRGIEANLIHVNFAELKEADASATVGKAIATYARQDPKRVAPCGTEFPNERSACRVLYQLGGSDLKQTLTQAGFKFKGYNVP